MGVLLSSLRGLGHVILEVVQALTPIVLIFALLQVGFLKLPRTTVISLTKGLVFTFLGFVFFLHGVQRAFLPVGRELGQVLGSLPARWILVPIGLGLGFLATMAEPAVHILASEVEEASSGTIRERLIIYTLAVGVAVMVSLGMVRVLHGINVLHILVPGYIMAFVLARWAGPTFTAIAFDSGGVATGPMTVSFVMAVAVGAAQAVEGRSAVIDGFGLIALVALAPIISVTAVGVIYHWKEGQSNRE